MALSMGERLRYAAYGLVALGAFAGYLWLETEENEVQRAGIAEAVPSDTLPEIGLYASAAHRAGIRDLFAFVSFNGETEAPPQVVLPIAPDPVMARADEPDSFSGVQVMGLVRRSDTITILLREGPSLKTVALDEPFGAQGRLAVQSVQGRDVVIIDKASRRARAFTLSED
ncbi:hypothetical protein Rvan_1819 [Rhodomicrobium vannielii ATCC 17100]|uniref:Uncharacterized protein n=1 Tax=Rhodomicrobium vannielii (strain ATCC 17100 / DSM 162 / LMG 4299 / NCIMB 10020 / ATH 3.1.1) TaxID=648757 RepID=E3HZM6_RHOVT|nr:hypothetical protein [Rhodomicrobium vannielii]ADP71061.1 hypothetical protein Rvan_1819 [Rhodomicrobium vannielii ATCC 17100]